GQTDAGARDGLFTVELRATQTALELQHDTAESAVAHQEIVAAPDDLDRQLLALGERERQADVLDILGNDEDVGRPPDAQGGVEAERFLEPHLAPDLS